jgi:hypothetical protein
LECKGGRLLRHQRQVMARLRSPKAGRPRSVQHCWCM